MDDMVKERVKWPVECLPGEDMGDFTDNSHLLRIFKNITGKVKESSFNFWWQFSGTSNFSSFNIHWFLQPKNFIH
jgi:hypothetical protein